MISSLSCSGKLDSTRDCLHHISTRHLSTRKRGEHRYNSVNNVHLQVSYTYDAALRKTLVSCSNQPSSTSHGFHRYKREFQLVLIPQTTDDNYIRHLHKTFAWHQPLPALLHSSDFNLCRAICNRLRSITKIKRNRHLSTPSRFPIFLALNLLSSLRNNVKTYKEGQVITAYVKHIG